ncbi:MULTISPECIES: type I-B CRISPR-associated protein Cas8b1/Cst1 [unclassified Methanoculleus]|uniref:type I-B CRISPR-associated protein Cas8b1/Cst1 n=1 Tax=unclassified Methanoculleus TaxID=2619537 RepID=UPI0025D09ED9|nr:MULTISPECIES: type I-B CRISPR-associated protein Cas8b1/Cst1 [unclassified Methanoculleus]
MLLQVDPEPKPQPRKIVGDPFIDTGILAIELMTEKPFDACTQEDLRLAADNLIDIYLTPAWKKELYSIFPNSTYIQSSRGYDHQGRSKKFLYGLIDGISNTSSSTTFCCYCGAPAHELMSFYKTHVPLIGSGSFTNFFPSFQNGLSICARCALAIQFAPLLWYKAGGKPCLVSSNNQNIIREFGAEVFKKIRVRLASGEYESGRNSGLFDEKFKSPQNALFHLAYKFGKEYCMKGVCRPNESVVLYRIDNYNQNPTGIRIYSLPSSVFRFVAFMMNSPDYRSAWFTLLNRHYAKAKGDEELPTWKTKYNAIHAFLLDGKSILWAFKDDKARIPTMPWVVIEWYMRSVRDMNQQRVDQIKVMSDNIALCIRESKKFNRVLDIAAARDLPSFRNQLQLLIKDWQKLGKEKPLTTFDDYTAVLLPGDYRGWTEVRDLMVIRLYEQLHDVLAKEVEPEEVTE